VSELTDATIIEADNPELVIDVELDYVAIPGPQGEPGEDGPPGAGILSGSGAPSNGLGNNGDFYLDYTNSVLYGPKSSGTWPSGHSLVGPEGDPGTPGTPGSPGSTGPAGTSILSGAGSPGGGVGNNGDFYINISNWNLHGPKSGGVWPAGVSLIGPAGEDGEDGEFVGNTVLYGSAAPTTEGSNGDFYIKTTDPKTIYGPKASGTWPSGTSLVGPQGIQGTTGTTGTPGTNGVDGRTILYGGSNPGSGVGANGDFYINTNTSTLFGPKASGAWPGGISLIGPQGGTGSPGANGSTVLSGTAAPTTEGANGDFYIRTSNSSIYGPKTGGAWGSPTSLIGATGTAGNTILNGTTAPSNGVGNNGDFYIRTDTAQLYGPKAAGAWPGTPTELKGPQGDQGIPGTTGSAGTNGNTILSGTSNPGGGTGVNGDFFINTATSTIFGPKASGSWPGGVSLVGPQGTTGNTGPTGNQLLHGTAVPTTEGVNGDFYLRTTTSDLYGPKTSGAWGSPTNLIGPQGPAGSGGSGGGGPIYYLCATDASTSEKAKASVVCDGTADNTDFVTAIAACQTFGIKLVLSSGTFAFAAQVAITGPGDVDVETYEVYIDGQGPGRTTIQLANNVASAFHISGVARVHMSNFRITVSGSSHGISAAATQTSTAGYRSFWLSSFKNLQIIGTWDGNHTGWGMHLGSPFRSVFENIDIGGTGNGIRCFSENTNFNPGDCTFTRVFIDLAGNNKIAYQIDSTTTGGVMNQITFNMCEAIASGTGCTGILIGGTGGTPGPSNHHKFWGTNLEQFDKLVEISRGEGNIIDCNYVETRAAANNVAFTLGANSFNNRVSAGFIYFASALTQYLYTDGNTIFPYQPNIIEKVKIYADSTSVVTKTENTAGTTVSRDIVVEGSGNGSAVLRGPKTGMDGPPVVITYAATISPDARAGRDFECTATGALTINGPANPTHGQKVFFYITASGANRTVTLATGAGNFKFGSDITALTATVSGTTDMIGAVYNSTANRWYVNAYVKGF